MFFLVGGALLAGMSDDGQPVTGQKAEGKLIADLLADYEVNARPVLETLATVHVTLSIAFKQLMHLVSTLSSHPFIWLMI